MTIVNNPLQDIEPSALIDPKTWPGYLDPNTPLTITGGATHDGLVRIGDWFERQADAWGWKMHIEGRQISSRLFDNLINIYESQYSSHGDRIPVDVFQAMMDRLAAAVIGNTLHYRVKANAMTSWANNAAQVATETTRDWEGCAEEKSSFAESMGLTWRPEQDWDVYMTVTVAVTKTVRAENEDDASDQAVELMDESDVEEAVRYNGIQDVEVDSVDVA